MATINVRIDDDLKARAYRELEKLASRLPSLCAKHCNTWLRVGSFPSTLFW